MDKEDLEELNTSVRKRKVVNNYRAIDNLIGKSYTSFLLSVEYEDLEAGTVSVRQLRDNVNLISEKSVKIPMDKFNTLLKESKGNQN